DAAKASPIVTTGRPSLESAAPYFVEEIRKYLEDTYGVKQLYENGLSVQTSLDLKLQGVAERALDDGLRRLAKPHGFRRPRNVLTEQHTVAGFTTDEWKELPEVGLIVPALVMGSGAGGAEVRVGRLRGLLGRESVAWTNKPPAALLKAGDLVQLRVTAIDE